MHITLLVSVLSVLVIGTSGGGSSSIAASEVYWNNVLPKTSMPKAIKDLLPDKVLPRTNKESTAKVLPVRHVVWNYGGPSTEGEEKSRYDPKITMYLFKEDLRLGSKMRLSFPNTSVYGVTFISNTQSNFIPFSSSKLPDILSFFSINSGSSLASAMKETLANCEYKQMEGEMKHCATSLESMVDFSTSVLKTHNLISKSTTTDKENTPTQEYEITSSYIKSSGDNTVLCHAQTYAYAVFYCHKLKGVDVFDVEMLGADRTKVKAVAACHTDTSKWNPNTLALRILNVKPGTVPVCHVLPTYDVMWMAT